MKSLTFPRGVLFALLSSLTAAMVFSVLPFASGATAMRFVISLLTFACLLWLLGASATRVGRATTFAVTTASLALTFFWAPPLAVYSLIHTGVLWLTRSLYFHNGLSSCVADLGLSLFALAAAIWAMAQSQSVFLSFWSFFLIQAAILPILNSREISAPNSTSHSAGNAADTIDHSDAFQRAHRNAEAALRKITLSR